ncbi:hypothetical protein HQ865_13560 [Mucilaginibacter mali]|uniref:Tetratricopeptide repeat protein n=1 Tax=Mucilaginibacter mali TaxID=2740462 RepID=A0A7D4TVQ3_9SPHI|nr:hypothetical protein [Mucilaginibacter mali]QKJ30735.1 hypothetical protein HQ865_13560 [Mucilaginibacter mali]
MENDSILQASRYADGEMEPHEQREFELLMQGDAQLRDYVEQYQQATVALQTHFSADENLDGLKQTLGNLNSQYFNPEAAIVEMRPTAKVVSFKTYARWISGVAAVLIIGLFIFNPWRKSLFEQYNTATTMSVAERGEGTQTNLEKAAVYYNKKEFTNAGNLLAKEYAADTTKSLVAYYYAITLIQNKQEAKARSILQSIYNGISAFKYDAAYYMALSYVKQKNNALAKQWLKLVPVGTANYKKASELLTKL